MYRRYYQCLLIITVILFANSLYAGSFPHYRFHKNFKSYAMGGAGVVQNPSVMTMFSNPANLRRFPENNADGEIFGTTIGVGDNTRKFSSDLQKAIDSGTTNEKRQKILELLDKYTGQVFSGNAMVTPFAVAYSSDFWRIDAQGIGLVSSVAFNLRPHNGSGSQGLLGFNSFNYGGIVYGIASDFDDFTVGINFKLMRYFALNRSYTVAELIDEDLADNVQNNDVKKGSSFAFDLGLNWEVASGDGWSIVTGIVANNIGGIGDSSLIRAYIPTTYDFGINATYELTSYTPIAFSLDYIDISDAYQDEADLKKRLNYGLDLRLFRSDYLDLGVQTGIHQAETTYGGDLMLFGFINLGYASYSEEFGVFAGQDPVRQDLYYFAFSF